MSRTVKCRDSAGTLVLDLSSTGYEIDDDGVVIGPLAHRRLKITSWCVGGYGEVQSVPDGITAEITLRLRGADQVEVETLYQALLAATVAPSSWLLEIVVDGVSYTYRADGADPARGFTTMEIDNAFCTVMLTIPVQPTPAITGI